jgi:glycosyltransferase involved in cell wall biosynthesis
MNVAVIMSVYRMESPQLFARAIDSVLNQDVDPSVRIKVYLGVDGDVPQELRDVIKSYESRIYRVIWFEKNRGLARVLNDLIAALEGEDFVFRMDTDDFSYPNRFQRQLAYLQAHPDVDILGTSIVEVGEGTKAPRVIHFSRESERSARRYIARGVPVAHPTVCFRGEVFKKICGYPTVRNNEDIALWFLCLRNGLKFENLREPLYEFTVNKDFLRRRGLEKAFTEFLVYARGIWILHGFTFDYFYPIARFMLRLSPRFVQNFAYQSTLRPRDIDEVAEPTQVHSSS